MNVNWIACPPDWTKSAKIIYVQNSQFPVSSTRPTNKVAEAWDAYRASQPEEWEMLADYIGVAYNRRRKL